MSTGRGVGGGPSADLSGQFSPNRHTQGPDTSTLQPWPLSQPATERDAHRCPAFSVQMLIPGNWGSPAQSLQMDFATAPLRCKFQSLHNRHKGSLSSPLRKKRDGTPWYRAACLHQKKTQQQPGTAFPPHMLMCLGAEKSSCRSSMVPPRPSVQQHEGKSKQRCRKRLYIQITELQS